MDSKSSPFEPDSTGDDDSDSDSDSNTTRLGSTLRVLEENSIVRLCKEKAQAVAAIGLYKSAIVYYQEKLDERDACIGGLEETVGSLEETCEMLASQLAGGQLPGEIDALGTESGSGSGSEIETDSDEEVDHLRAQLDNLHNELEDTNLQNLSLATQLSERMCAYVDMRIDLVGTKNELATAMQDLRTEEASHRASKVQSEEKIAQISKELAKRDEFIANLVKEKEFTNVKFAGFEKMIQELSIDLVSLESKLKERGIEGGFKSILGSPGIVDSMLPTPTLTPPPTVRLLPLPLAMPLPSTPPKTTTISANGEDVSATPGSSQRSRAPPQIPKQFIHTLVLNQAKSNSNLNGTFFNFEPKLESTTTTTATTTTTSATSTSFGSASSGSSSGSGSKEGLGSSSSSSTTPARSPSGGDEGNGDTAAPRKGRRRRRNRHFNRKRKLREVAEKEKISIASEGSVQKEVQVEA
ncbi:hypothetical protein NLI96_g11706 [Meripilus lineatus]|uniref:Uncharacterized protein n=1 Tax=Meripilus lineatus TaxID=2056292 RepID=A0AAD5URA0_9APHY|nr:hypothetical protein NLI96_g11706 [Physisporinus lineatus]